ncbi:MAG: HYExAFE family protein [Phycisphaerae bacterium]
MKSHIHYEAAFEHYLQTEQIAYVAVDESKKAAFRDARLKSFDFIVYSRHDTNWLTDIKGRRWAPRKAGGRPTWENWATQADLDALRQWQEIFGSGFRAMLLFAYWIDPQMPDPPADLVHMFREQRYVFAGVPLDDYVAHARLRSPKWATLSVPVAAFGAAVRPIAQWV